MRTVFGLFLLGICAWTGFHWQQNGFALQGEQQVWYAMGFLFLGLPCGLTGAWLLLRR
jgi:hypothetical protein